ncbi:hypothetical protein MBLNU459_g5607t1 [Dothideomycetes sp. NU459]
MESTMHSYHARLQSFQSEHRLAKRRASSQKKKQHSAVQWPHQVPAPEHLARAGFFYSPSSDSDDNVQCFLCAVALDGWELGDDPMAEHLAHSTECGWVLSLSVQNEAEERDPMSPELVLARSDTYGAMWPHEAKKGWKCKTQKMVDAGWSFDPSPDAEDGVTCFYCSLSLDGWEPKDNPLEEHRRRSPECPFFSLVHRHASLKPAKKTGRARASSTSKPSRLSTQSIQSTFSEAPSLMSLGDVGAEMDVEQSVAIDTTITSDAGKGKKKASKTKAQAKARKKAVRDQSVEPMNALPEADQLSAAPGSFPEEAVIAPAPESQSQEEAPKPKRGRKAKATEDSQIEDASLAGPAPKAAKSRSKAKPAASTPARISQDASQLQSELHEAVSFASAVQSPPQRTTRTLKRTSDGTVKQEDPILDTVEEEPPLPKKTARAPAKAKKGKKTAKGTQDDSEMIHAPVEDLTELGSSQGESKPKRSKKANKAAEVEQPMSQVEVEQPEVDIQMEEEPAQRESEEDSNPTPAAEEFEATPTPQKPRISDHVPAPEDARAESTHSTPSSDHSQQFSDAENQPPSSSVRAPPTTKAAPVLAAAPTLQQPPQMFESPTKTTRIPLAASTPNRSPSRARSPQKQLGRLTSDTPWQPVDLETAFFASPEKGREEDVSAKLAEVAGLLTSPEKKMSVEEWIRWRAQQAESKLKGECERMVGLFEKAGTRGLSVLEGVRTLEV